MTTVLLQTTMGDVKIELLDKTMPITAGNFRKLVAQGFYDGTIFHRVIPNFMIQGGDPQGTGLGGPGYTIKDELPADNRNARGTISMANAGPNTGGSQFFVNVVDNNRLDRKHPVFGRVVGGMEVVDAISRTPTTGRGRKSRSGRPPCPREPRPLDSPEFSRKAQRLEMGHELVLARSNVSDFQLVFVNGHAQRMRLFDREHGPVGRLSRFPPLVQV